MCQDRIGAYDQIGVCAQHANTILGSTKVLSCPNTCKWNLTVDYHKLQLLGTCSSGCLLLDTIVREMIVHAKLPKVGKTLSRLPI